MTQVQTHAWPVLWLPAPWHARRRLLFTEPDQLWRLSKSELTWLHTRRPSKLKDV